MRSGYIRAVGSDDVGPENSSFGEHKVLLILKMQTSFCCCCYYYYYYYLPRAPADARPGEPAARKVYVWARWRGRDRARREDRLDRIIVEKVRSEKLVRCGLGRAEHRARRNVTRSVKPLHPHGPVAHAADAGDVRRPGFGRAHVHDLAYAHARAVLDCARIEPSLVRDATQRRELGAHFFILFFFFGGGGEKTKGNKKNKRNKKNKKNKKKQKEQKETKRNKRTKKETNEKKGTTRTKNKKEEKKRTKKNKKKKRMKPAHIVCFEALVVGMCLALMFYAGTRLVPRGTMYTVAVAFACGALFHIACEIFGVNAWYARTYFAPNS